MTARCRLLIVSTDGTAVMKHTAIVRVSFAANCHSSDSFEEFDAVPASAEATGGSFVVECQKLLCCKNIRMCLLIDCPSLDPVTEADKEFFAVLRDVTFVEERALDLPLLARAGSVPISTVLTRLLNELEGAQSELLSRVVLTRKTNPVSWNHHRKVWNGLVDRSPAMIIVARDEADVCRAVAVARELSLELTVKGGGHSVAGLAVADGALMIDLSNLTRVTVHVDQSPPLVSVGGGCTWAHVDAALHPHGLAVPAGNVKCAHTLGLPTCSSTPAAHPSHSSPSFCAPGLISHTGVGGLTLGGGIGYCSRYLGLSCDALVAARVVSSNGRALNVNAEENSELLWVRRKFRHAVLSRSCKHSGSSRWRRQFRSVH
jgi:hypothetical protein